MDAKKRDTLCNECLEFVKNAATVTLTDADEGAFQKSGTLRQIAARISDTLAQIDAEKNS